MITTGDIAPDFTLPRDGGTDISLSALRPQRVVLFFYPKTGTTNCAIEADDFNAALSAFAAAGATLIGLSKDPVKAQEKAVKKQALGYALVSDAEADACERYGVWVEKSMYGKAYMGIERATYLIGADGRVARAWHKVKVEGHVAEVLAAVQAL